MNTKEIIQDLSLQFLKGQLNEFELVNRLITSAEKGGAGLSQEQAQKTFDKLLEYKKKLEVHGMRVDQLVSSVSSESQPVIEKEVKVEPPAAQKIVEPSGKPISIGVDARINSSNPNSGKPISIGNEDRINSSNPIPGKPISIDNEARMNSSNHISGKPISIGVEARINSSNHISGKPISIGIDQEKIVAAENKIIKLQDLQIDSHKEHGVGEHRMELPHFSTEKTIEELLINPGHDLNMPLDKHIKFHFDQIKAEPELPAAPKQVEVTTPPPLKNIPAKTSPDKIMPPPPAPLPARIAIQSTSPKITEEKIALPEVPVMPPLTAPSPVIDRAVNMPEPMIARTSDGILPSPKSEVLGLGRVVPAQLKQMAEQNMAPEGTDLIKETIAKRAKKPGFFSRIFSHKKAMPVTSPTSVSPMMPSETINAIPVNQGRPQMNDVTFTPKLVTPVDELQSLSLQDFRRLSKDPLTAIKKISDKLELLSQESLRKKSEGIEALKKSALYSNYSAIMSESVIKGISYNQVIAERKTLTEAEYQALMQLNKLLRS